MENFLSFDPNVLEYIDSLQNLDEVNAAKNFWNDKRLRNIFWKSFKTYFETTSRLEKQKAKLKCAYINRCFGSFIPLSANLNPFVAPHCFYGIFISSAAKIGTGCTIYQHVTIGINTMPDSKNSGAPTLGDNVYIGAGAKIIGNIKIGNNVRIGAGCSVARDVPDNCTVVQSLPAIIKKSFPQDNTWISQAKYLKLKSVEKIQGNTPPRIIIT